MLFLLYIRRMDEINDGSYKPVEQEVIKKQPEAEHKKNPSELPKDPSR